MLFNCSNGEKWGCLFENKNKKSFFLWNWACASNFGRLAEAAWLAQLRLYTGPVLSRPTPTPSLLVQHRFAGPGPRLLSIPHTRTLALAPRLARSPGRRVARCHRWPWVMAALTGRPGLQG
jgi:hypothetical protein